MVTYVSDRKNSRFQTIITIFANILIAAILSGCGQSTSNHTSSSGSVAVATATATPTPPTATSTPTPLPPTPTPTPIVSLQGPTNFILHNTLIFSQASGTGMVNGATTQLSSDTVERGVISTFQHTLFVVDSSNNITVYTNSAPSPVQARTSKNADGSVNIGYTHSSNAGTTTFDGVLTGSQMKATYTTDFIGGTTVNGQTFSGGSTSTSTFTTQVQRLSADQIPSAPTNGRYQFTSDGGVSLTWSGNASGYDIYRFVLTDSRGFQFLTKTSSTSYVDESQTTRNNAQTVTGISYAIYAVGSTGIENPSCITLSVSSLG